MAFQGYGVPVLQTGFSCHRFPVGFSSRDFFVCGRGAGETTPCGLCAGIRPNRRQRRRSERRKARACPPCAHAGGLRPPSLPEPVRQTTGAPAARRRGRAHTARQAERARPEAGRQTAETAGMQGRAPRAQPTAPQARGTRARPPSPAIISARVFAACGEHDGGKGGAPLDGRGGGRGASPRVKDATAQQPQPRRYDKRQHKRPEASRGRADRTQERGVNPHRGRTGERGQRPSRPDGRRRGGQRAREPPHLHPTPQLGRDHASGRRRGGQGGRRRRRPGGTRTREQAATHAISAEKRHARTRKPQARPTWRPAHHGGRRFHPCADRRASGRARSGARPERRRADRWCLGWPDSVSSPSLPRFTAFGEQLSPFCRKNAQKGEKRKSRY